MLKGNEIFLESAVNEDKELLELLTTSDADNEGLEESVRAIQEGDRKKNRAKILCHPLEYQSINSVGSACKVRLSLTCPG